MKESSQYSATSLANAALRYSGTEAFNKGVVPLYAKKTVPTWGGSVFFARPDFNKNGNGAPFPKIVFMNCKIHDRHHSNNHRKTGHGHKPHNRSTFLQIRASPFALPAHRQNLPRPCIRRYSHCQNRLLGRIYPPRISYDARYCTILEMPLFGFRPYLP